MTQQNESSFSSWGLWDEVTLVEKATGLSRDKVKDFATYARERKLSFLDVVLERSGVSEADLLRGLARELHLEYFSDDTLKVGYETLSVIPASQAIAHDIFPLAVEPGPSGRVKVLLADPVDLRHWDEIVSIVRRPLTKVLCARVIIQKLIRSHYGVGADTVAHLTGQNGAPQIEVIGVQASGISGEQDAANEPTVVGLVNQIICDAIAAGATDIHFEAYETKYRIRYRIDGLLEDASIPASVKMLQAAMVSRIKIMSNLDITEKRLPQDGRCQVKWSGQEYDLRVSILPGIHAEAVNMRIQSRQAVKMDLLSLGFEPREQIKVEALIDKPHGLFLVTGPTGSGKTTTLYTCLTKINKTDTKIITVEDPVEYWMDNILQMQVHDEIGFTFGRALRSMLRHDPDVMLVGEVRDRETADIAIRSALTGHLVFATLHTNDAPGAFARLTDIGIEPFLVASSVHGVLAQRLVRKICSHCKQKAKVASSFEEWGARSVELTPELLNCAMEGAGCDKCRFTGHKGRMVVTEVLVVSPAIRRLIQERASADQIKETAIKEGMTTLRHSAKKAVEAGQTTVAEMFIATQEDI